MLSTFFNTLKVAGTLTLCKLIDYHQDMSIEKLSTALQILKCNDCGEVLIQEQKQIPYRMMTADAQKILQLYPDSDFTAKYVARGQYKADIDGYIWWGVNP